MSKRARDEGQDGPGGSGEQVIENLSVDDTNKLREKLGLKPLVEGDGKESEQAKADAILDAERKAVEQRELAAKLKKAKEKREYKQKSGRKSIAQENEDEDDTASWVKKMRKKQGKAPTAAEKQAKMFDDVDEAEQEAAYTAKDLKGLKMNAELSDFKEGSEVIMTLKDERILDGDAMNDGEDQLENLGLVDLQKAKKNKKLKAYDPTVSAYKGLDDDEWNADGSINMKKKSILQKYDNLVDGQDKEEEGPSLTIGELNKTAAEAREAEAKKDEIRGKIKDNLNTMAFKKIAETYTSEEMATFAKPKKKRKVKKKKQSINWDEEEAKAIGQDHGSRSSRNMAKEKARSAKISNAKADLAYEQALDKAADHTAKQAEMAYHTKTEGPEYDSEEEDDLGAALAKARQLKQTRIAHESAEALASKVAQAKEEEEMAAQSQMDVEVDSEEEDEEKMTMDATTEFCKMVEAKEEGAEEEEEEDALQAPMVVEDEEEEEMHPTKQKAGDDSDDSDEEVQEDFTNDKLVSGSMGAALSFIRGRGALEDTHEGVTGRFNDKVLESEHVERQASGEGKKLNSFTLEYRDKFGRKMSQKEAFRQLSYGFHGKGPGKSKIEARQRKYAEEQRLRKQGQNGAIDQPITLQALKVQQKGTRQAHMVIGGGASGMRHND